MDATKRYNLNDAKIVKLYAVELDPSMDAFFKPMLSKGSVIAQYFDTFFIGVRQRINSGYSIAFWMDEAGMFFEMQDLDCRLFFH